MKPHKWAKEIKAWADGAEIESRVRVVDCWLNWETNCLPSWHTEDSFEYRIKPKTRKAIIDGVEYVLPEALPNDIVRSDIFFSAESGNALPYSGTTMYSRCFATREDAELFAKAEKALRGIQ